MKKTIITFLAIIPLTLYLLTSCHGKVQKGNVQNTAKDFIPQAEFDETKNYEITFWAKNDTNIEQTNIYEKAIRDFEKLYPNIKVNYKPYTDYRRIYQDVITNIATDTTPNVCITYPDHIATYITGKDTVIPLDTLLADENYGFAGKKLKFDSPSKEEIVSKFLEEGVINGRQYALPFMRSTEACYINKTYVEKLGYKIPEVLTWDFIWEVSEKAMEKNADGTFKINGQKVLIPFIYKSTDNMMIQMLKQKRYGYSSENGEVLIFNNGTRNLLKEISLHAKSRAFSTFKISSYPANFLNAGQCIFAIDSTAGATWMGSDAPNSDISEENIIKFETVIKPVPQYDIENPIMISQGPSVCIFHKEDEGVVMASWLFTQYLLTNNVQIPYAQTEGYLPVTHKAQNSADYKNYLSREGENNKKYYDIKIKASKLLMDNIDNTFVTPVFNGSADLRSASGDLIEEVSKAVRRKKTADDALIDEIFDKVSSLYRLDSIIPVQSGTESSGSKPDSVVSVQSGQAKRNFGALPTGSIILISSLVLIWTGLIIYAVISRLKTKK